MVHYTSGDIGAFDWASTNIADHGPVQYANGQYYTIFNSATVTFNTEVSWNSNFQYDNGSGPLMADGRKVAAHETGHVECLDHTGYTAIMHQGAESFYTLQTNDIQGLQAIITGYIPS